MIYGQFDCEGKHVVFREPAWDDLEGFMAAANSLYEESMQAPVWLPTHPMDLAKACDALSKIMKQVKLGTAFYVFLEFDGAYGGMGWVQTKPKEAMFGQDYGTLGIQMTKECRRKGLGKKLMNILEEEARIRDYRGLYLTVADRNDAMKLYELLGYREVGRKPNFVVSRFGNEPFSDRAALVDMIKLL